MGTTTALNIAVGIPTIGRAAILGETLRELSHQTRRPDSIIVCGVTAADLADPACNDPGVLCLHTAAGLPRQRNACIDAAPQADILLFLDDDFLPAPGYLRAIEQCMLSDPRIVLATGRVLADGIGGPGLTPQEGRAVLARTAPPGAGRTQVFSGYGCNMAIRLAPVREHRLRFDERLPLYGWQEDVDLSRRLAPFGTLVLVEAAIGVHLGAKSGRNSGVRLGYSQVANPLYLAGKHEGYPLRRAITHIARNLAKNIARWPRPEPYVDRRGRLRGNAIALGDMLRGRMTPERVLDL